MAGDTRTAVVFADRLGDGLKPLFSHSCPALIPIAGKTPLEFCLDDLGAAGIERAIVVVSPCADEIQARLGDGDAWGMELDFVLSRGGEDPLHLIGRFRSLLAGDQLLAVRGDVLRSGLTADYLALATAASEPLPATVDGRAAGVLLCSGDYAGLGALSWPLVETVDGHDCAGHRFNPLASLEDVLLAGLDTISGAYPGLVLPGLETQPGVRVGRLSHLAPASVDVGPVHIGDHSSVHKSCKLYGPVAIGENCFIDRDTQISDSLILPGTYIGAGLDVTEAIVGEGQLIRPRESLVMQIDDPLWVAPMESASRASDRSLLDRLAALVLTALALPLWLAAGLLAAAGSARLFDETTQLGNRRGVRGQRLEFRRFRFAAGPPVLRELPGLLAVLRGDLRMFGARPAVAGASSALPLSAAAERPPAGLIAPSALHLDAAAPPEEVELFEICFAAERSLGSEARCWARSLARLFSPRSWSAAQAAAGTHDNPPGGEAQ